MSPRHSYTRRDDLEVIAYILAGGGVVAMAILFVLCTACYGLRRQVPEARHMEKREQAG